MDNECNQEANIAFQQGKQAYDKKLFSEAVKWLRKAAEACHAQAQYYLGLCYQIGGDALRNDEEALKWIRRAAENGCTKAQERLGDMYNHGWGVPYDAYEAYQWYLKSGNTSEADELLRVHEMMQ
jgi:TPR repeat protein